MIRVLIVDDSALIRQLLTDILSGDPELEVVGAARDPFVARDMIKALSPDVLTLDVEMPRMDGLTFLRNLMRLRPMPVVMVSTRTAVGADATMEALSLGAVDFVAKPESDIVQRLTAYGDELVAKVKSAARARMVPLRIAPSPLAAADKAPIARSTAVFGSRLIAIGASTGGTEAIAEVMQAMPVDAPPIVITQHMPPGFTSSFARRLDQQSRLRVAEAVSGARLMPGHAYLAPGGRHLRVGRDGGHLVCRLDDGPPVNRHRPSVDVLFHSVAEVVGVSAVAALLTGMGDDGARGLHEVHAAGGAIMVQDAETSVVWGMPGAAVKLGPVDDVLPIGRIGARLLERSRGAPVAA